MLVLACFDRLAKFPTKSDHPCPKTFPIVQNLSDSNIPLATSLTFWVRHHLAAPFELALWHGNCIGHSRCGGRACLFLRRVLFLPSGGFSSWGRRVGRIVVLIFWLGRRGSFWLRLIPAWFRSSPWLRCSLYLRGLLLIFRIRLPFLVTLFESRHFARFSAVTIQPSTSTASTEPPSVFVVYGGLFYLPITPKLVLRLSHTQYFDC